VFIKNFLRFTYGFARGWRMIVYPSLQHSFEFAPGNLMDENEISISLYANQSR
jgi:hypothetical protein